MKISWLLGFLLVLVGFTGKKAKWMSLYIQRGDIITILKNHILQLPTKTKYTRWVIYSKTCAHIMCNYIILVGVILYIKYWRQADGSSYVKCNESGFRPPLCTYRLNWARRTSWRWWGDWDDTVLQTQDSKFEPWRSEAEHATSRSWRLSTILTFTRGWGRNIFLFLSNRREREPNPELWRERQRC